MAGLQRSVISFRRQGSSGLIWEDKYLSGQLVKHKQETNKAGNVTELEGQPKEEMLLQVKASSTTVGSTGRSRSNGGFPTASLVIEPSSPKVSACGLCSAISGKKSKSRCRLQYGKHAL